MTTAKYTKEDVRPTWVTVDDNTFFDDEGKMDGVVNPTILVGVEVGGVERGCACFQRFTPPAVQQYIQRPAKKVAE